MKVDKSLEGPNGTVQFQGELSSEEVDVILGVGLNFLMQQGALPFKVIKDMDKAKLAPHSETFQ